MNAPVKPIYVSIAAGHGCRNNHYGANDIVADIRALHWHASQWPRKHGKHLLEEGVLQPSGTLPNPISGHDFPISVYPNIEPDIGYDIADTRYRVFPDIGYPYIGINIGICRYRDQMSRYWVIAFPDIAHDVSCSQQAPGPGLGLAFRLPPPAHNR